jgi:hypothetical protein
MGHVQDLASGSPRPVLLWTVRVLCSTVHLFPCVVLDPVALSHGNTSGLRCGQRFDAQERDPDGACHGAFTKNPTNVLAPCLRLHVLA